MKRDHAAILILVASTFVLFVEGRAVSAGDSTEPLDAGPILSHNRDWLHPDLQPLKSVTFKHAMAPIRYDERFAWRRDGASLVELIDSQYAADQVGQRWLTTPVGQYWYFAPQSKYAQEKPTPEGGLDRYFRYHLMGTRTNFVALDWGWKRVIVAAVRGPAFGLRWGYGLDGVTAYGEEMSPSIKAFGSRDLSLAKCRDYGRDRGSEVRFPPDRSGST